MKLYAMDTSTFKVSQPVGELAALPEVYRENPGVYFDPVPGKPYVYGGMREGVPLGDLLVVDVNRGEWEKVSEADGPALASKPFLNYDRRRGVT